ncbi:polysaccharide deacetylase family protein [Halomarina oriensis]|uniref:Polysaccharide deacetylase family protein n=1 Tax=Halomarina oriensis TaxID=671145 RepID=A0A6B0GEN9_9EURY|nr:polysaccharide deacetylase family protein [Halomarina oriensis]MWG33184.1 polysaccharide deacetylase family protein [Halomarina oriensis]
MTGTVTISLELELGWGVTRFGMLDKISPGRERETTRLDALLDRCALSDVPITFNVVGHLLLAECDGHHEGPYPDDWWDIDPGSSVYEAPKFYAPDLVEAIRESPTPHEICTHTFSHIECAEVPEETVAHDLRTAHAAHERFGLDDVVSLVPPRHSTPPRDVLREVGIETVRVPHYRSSEFGDPRTPLHKLREIITGPHPVAEPHLVDGVVETYSPVYKTLAAEYLPLGEYDTHPAYRWIPTSVGKRLHRRYHRRALDRAVETGGHVHFWSHLYDIATDEQWPQIDALLADIGERVERGELEVKTMAELNRDVRRELEGPTTAEERPDVVELPETTAGPAEATDERPEAVERRPEVVEDRPNVADEQPTVTR